MKAAVTFDFWDTIAIDESDEPQRLERGLLRKSDARRALFLDWARAKGASEEASVQIAYNDADARFQKLWKESFMTPRVI